MLLIIWLLKLSVQKGYTGWSEWRKVRDGSQGTKMIEIRVNLDYIDNVLNSVLLIL